MSNRIKAAIGLLALIGAAVLLRPYVWIRLPAVFFSQDGKPLPGSRAYYNWAQEAMSVEVTCASPRELLVNLRLPRGVGIPSNGLLLRTPLFEIISHTPYLAVSLEQTAKTDPQRPPEIQWLTHSVSFYDPDAHRISIHW